MVREDGGWHIFYFYHIVRLEPSTQTKLSISGTARDSNIFVCSKKLSDSDNLRNYFVRIEQIPLRKLFLYFELNRTTFYFIQKVAISRYSQNVYRD